jgi:hypothetical protein
MDGYGDGDGDRDIRLAGTVAFYSPVDWTRGREERDETNPIARK